MTVIKQETLDAIAELEANALLDGLHDEELKRTPAFLEKVRKFLKENNLKTTAETPGVREIQKDTTEIPIFDLLEGGCK